MSITFDPQSVESYFKQEPSYLIPSFMSQVPYLNMNLAHPIAFKAASGKATDPDLFSYDEAMRDPTHRTKWMEAAQAEISALESKGTWIEVPITDAKSRILPGTWVFRVKRSPDGEIRKYKARYCIRGDLQEVAEDVNTYAPVVAWTTVRMFLVMSMILKWKTISIDFSNAFVQADLPDPIWIHLPRGFRSTKGSSTCLKMLKSLYGDVRAPRLWFEHLFRALLKLGFVQSKHDPCLLYKKGLMAVFYVDDAGIAAKDHKDIDSLIKSLHSAGFELTVEGSFTEFLGIKFTENKNGTITLTQKGLIDKIIKATGLELCNPNKTPTTQTALGIDPTGEPMKEDWSYPSIVGMLLYLSTNTRPDIAFAVSQVARFGHNPKKSHASAVKTIVRYLSNTSDKGTIVSPTGKLDLDCYVDADFAGLYKSDPDEAPTAAKSRLGYIIFLSNCPLIWKSQLLSEISLSTLEAEYSALSQAMRAMIPLRSLLLEMSSTLGLPLEIPSTIKCTIFEDNNGELLLATNQRITSRTKYYLVKWHHFWSHIKPQGPFDVEKIDTKKQRADYMTKGQATDGFENNRFLCQGWLCICDDMWEGELEYLTGLTLSGL